MKVDLHAHSNASDGALSPAQVVELAASCGVELFSLTDHDTVRGLEEAQQAADRFGMRFVPGVEMSVLWGGCTVHVVGLGVRYRDGGLARDFSGVGPARLARGREIAARLTELGFPGAFEGALRFCRQPDSLGRAHFARWLLLKGYVSGMQEAFELYLGEGCPAYVNAPWPSLEEGVSLIRSYGAIAVLAHPGRYRLNGRSLGELALAFKASGGQAIEVSSGSQSADSEREIFALAWQCGFWCSTGSDFHSLSGSRPRPGEQRPLPEGCDPVWNHFGDAVPPTD